ncbi:MAG TPA: hypothetical protein VL181_04590, partial [Holophagaceae bacterium]|nr:hypothetical protein [Holophagaceae bacterium]
LYFASEAVDGLLVGFAFTWASRTARTVFLFPLFCLTLRLAAFAVISDRLFIRIAQWPGMILSEPLGLLAGGGLALFLLRRRRAAADPEADSA